MVTTMEEHKRQMDLLQMNTNQKWEELMDLMRNLVMLKQEEAQRTLRVKIHLLEYTISREVLNQVFSRFGNIESIEKLDQDAQYHSKICFRERDSALKALDCYDGMCIYDGCCLLELSIEVPFYEPTSHRADRGSLILPPRSSSMLNCKDQELSAPGSVVAEEEEIIGVHSCGSGLEYSGDDGNAYLEAKPTTSEVNSEPGANVQQQESLELPSTEANVQRRETLECPLTEIRAPKVVSNLDEEPKELQKINDGIVETEAMHHVVLLDPLPEGNTQSPELEIVVGNIRWKRVVEGSEISMESLAFLNAYKVFEEMPSRKNGLPKPLVVTAQLVIVYAEARTLYATTQRRLNFPSLIGHYNSSFVFDPGGWFADIFGAGVHVLLLHFVRLGYCYSVLELLAALWASVEEFADFLVLNCPLWVLC